jgi:protein TonB
VNPIDRELPEEPEEPQRPQTEPIDSNSQQRPEPEIETPDLDLDNSFGGGPFIETGPMGTGRSDGRAEPVSRVQPEWPRRALTQGIEGWVRVQFTIRADGTVSNARVVESQPGQLFDRSAVRAIERWRFRPRVVDGRAVNRQATLVLEFKLDNTTH